MTDSVYCPFCKRHLYPECDDDGLPFYMPEGGLLYVHDGVPHDPDYQFEELQ